LRDDSPVPATTFSGLRELRERHLGFAQDFVARRTGLALDRLAKLEAGEAPTAFEAEQLAVLYGIDAESLVEEPIRLSGADSLTLLAQHDEFREVSSDTRALILRAAQAARDAVLLRRLAGEADGAEAFARRSPPPQHARRAAPFQQGAEAAQWLRRTLPLEPGPIPSLRDLVRESFPEVVLLHAHLGRDGVSGLAFADRLRGPTLVLNLDGKNENPLVRRFSLAHELAHLVLDWNRTEPFGALSGFRDDGRLDVEQRANAFAIRLLCPEHELLQLLAAATPEQAIVQLAERWGMHFDAARTYLRNVAHVEVQRDPTQAELGASVRARWASAEDPELGAFPIANLPPERVSEVARVSALAYVKGAISRDRFARALGATPESDVERVLDFYSLDAPVAA